MFSETEKEMGCKLIASFDGQTSSLQDPNPYASTQVMYIALHTNNVIVVYVL